MGQKLFVLAAVFMLLIAGSSIVAAVENTAINQTAGSNASPANTTGTPGSRAIVPTLQSKPVLMELTINKAVDMALKKSADYENALLDVEIYRMKVNEARAGKYPSATISASGTSVWTPTDKTGSTSSVDKWLSDKFNIIGSLDLSFSMTLYSFGALTHSIYMYEDMLKIRLQTLQKLKKTITLNVKKAFYGYIIAIEQYKVAEESYKVNRSSYDIARRNFLRGLKPQIEMLQAEVSMEETRSSMISAVTAMKNSLDTLADLVGDVVKKEGVKVKGSLETEYLVISLGNAITTAYSNNHDLYIAEINNSVMKHQRVVTQSNARPIISLFGSSGLTHAPDYNNLYQRTGSRASFNFQLGIRIALPLTELVIKKSKTNSQVAQVDYQMRQTANTIKSTKDQIKLKLTTLFNTKKALEKQIKLYRALVKVAKKNLNLAMIRYRTGNMDYLTMKNIEVQFINVSYSYNKLLYDYRINKTEILDEMGINISN